MQHNLTRNDLLFSHMRNFLKAYIVFILWFLSFRLGFLIYFGFDKFSPFHTDLFQAFFVGAKYDGILFGYAVVPSFLLLTFSCLFRSLKFTNFLYKLTKIYLSLILFVYLVITIIDYGFYSYFQDHINILIFGVIEDDTQALLESILKNYQTSLIVAGVGFFALLILISLTLRPVFKPLTSRSMIASGSLKFLFIFLSSFALLAGLLRGGYEPLVISPKYTDFSDDEFINQLSYNGVIALEQALRLRQETEGKGFSLVKKYGYKGKEKQAFEDYLGVEIVYESQKDLLSLLTRTTAENPKVEELRPHVVLFLMESFGSHWMKFNNSEFDFLGNLPRHFEEDIYFDNFIASGQGTIGSLIVIGSNIPNRPGMRFLSESKYMNKKLPTAAHIPFKQNGYESSFVYGGKLSWRNIGKYFKVQGFDQVIGENTIKKELELKGDSGTEWGLYDEHLFTYISQKLNSSKTPQFIIVLTTTNHPPFEVPKQYKEKNFDLTGELKTKITREEDLFKLRFKAFEYSNTKLAEFISQVKASSLAEKSIISVTGDHNFWGFMNYTTEENYSKYRVPFYIYAPKSIKPESWDKNKVGGHEDIMATLYNIALSNTPYLTFGDNLFSEGESNALGPGVYANEKGVIYKGKKFKWNGKPLISIDPSINLDEFQKQYQSIFAITEILLDSTENASEAE